MPWLQITCTHVHMYVCMWYKIIGPGKDTARHVHVHVQWTPLMWISLALVPVLVSEITVNYLGTLPAVLIIEGKANNIVFDLDWNWNEKFRSYTIVTIYTVFGDLICCPDYWGLCCRHNVVILILHAMFLVFFKLLYSPSSSLSLKYSIWHSSWNLSSLYLAIQTISRWSELTITVWHLIKSSWSGINLSGHCQETESVTINLPTPLLSLIMSQ